MQEEWTIQSLLEWTTHYFNQKNISAARLEAELLLAQVLKQDRIYLYANYDKPVNNWERSSYKEFVLRRVRGEPNAYITGQKEFMSLNMKVNPAVLIPRPETELLVEETLIICKERGKVRICDIGTGSGAIAVSLAYYCPQAQVYAGEISQSALAVAAENANIHGVQVDFRQGDLLEPFFEEEPFDIIVANLPYIAANEYEELMREVRDYEPAQALLAGYDGLDLYRRMIPQARKLLLSGGYIIIEIGWSQSAQVIEMLAGFSQVQVKKDFAGIDRLVKARKV